MGGVVHGSQAMGRTMGGCGHRRPASGILVKPLVNFNLNIGDIFRILYMYMNPWLQWFWMGPCDDIHELVMTRLCQ